ncbi:MAG: mechanosensitive ion channel domain-containing protein [Saprospiraceae bacterium]
MLNKLLDFSIAISGSYSVSIGQLLLLTILIVLTYLAIKLTKAKWRIDFFDKYSVEGKNRRRFEKLIKQFILLCFGFFSIRLMNLDFELYNIGSDENHDGIAIRYSIILIAILILVLVWIIEWFLSNILINKYGKENINQEIDEKSNDEKSKVTHLVQYIVIILAGIAILKKFDLDYSIFPYSINSKPQEFKISIILTIILIYLLAKVVNWVISQIALYGLFKSKNIDEGSQYAINQLLKYVIFTFATIFAINSLGIDMTIVWGGAAALLVGIGLGLQQTFNDFFSGLVLLFERSVSVGDIMDMDGQMGTVKKIGLRASIVETIDNLSLIVPNSKLVNHSVKNYSHFVNHGRFNVLVSVAYGSDTELVKTQLLKAAHEHKSIFSHPRPFVQFTDFSDSALSFRVLFFANKFMEIEDIKSDLRFRIDQLFRENNIKIPFPQRDIWIKSQPK